MNEHIALTWKKLDHLAKMQEYLRYSPAQATMRMPILNWGHAKDYVRMQWMMPQQDKAVDFVIAIGVLYRVREFINKTAKALGMTLTSCGSCVDEVVTWVEGNKAVIKIDTRYYRPTEVETLLGDPTKAKEKLGWTPEITLDDMVIEMVASDLEAAKRQVLLGTHG